MKLKFIKALVEEGTEVRWDEPKEMRESCSEVLERVRERFKQLAIAVTVEVVHEVELGPSVPLRAIPENRSEKQERVLDSLPMIGH